MGFLVLHSAVHVLAVCARGIVSKIINQLVKFTTFFGVVRRSFYRFDHLATGLHTHINGQP